MYRCIDVNMYICIYLFMWVYTHKEGPKRPHKYKDPTNQDVWYPQLLGPRNQNVRSLCLYCNIPYHTIPYYIIPYYNIPYYVQYHVRILEFMWPLGPFKGDRLQIQDETPRVSRGHPRVGSPLSGHRGFLGGAIPRIWRRRPKDHISYGRVWYTII